MRKLNPSSAARRMACPGSWQLEGKYPQTDHSAGLEGNAAHWVAHRMIETHDFNPELYKTAPNGEPVTNEMIECGKLYYDDVINSNVKKTIVEKLVVARAINDQAVGYVDCYGFVDAASLIIWDYKFGHGFIDVFENWQLITYAAGVLNEYGMMHRTNIRVTFRIVQPRCYQADAIREWSLTVAELLPYFERLKESEGLAIQPDAQCRVSNECLYCPARHVCTTLENSALQYVDYVSQNHARELTKHALSTELRLLQKAQETINARINGLETEALSKIERGEQIPYFTREFSNGREVWDKPIEQVKALGSIYGIEIMQPAKPITPNQAEKLGLPEEVKKRFVTRPKGKAKLTLINEKEIQKIFTMGER